jgi:ribosomal protein S6--L-glutamate ligase
MIKKLKILYLCNSVESATDSKIAKEILGRGHELLIKSVNSLFFQVSNTIGHDKLFETTPEGYNRIYSNTIDVVLWRGGGSPREHSRRLIDYFKNLGVPTSHTSQSIYNCSDKLRATVLTSLNKIRTPKTTSLISSMDFQTVVKCTGGKLPIICKTVTGSQGSGVFWLNDEVGAMTTLQTLFDRTDLDLLAQEYIPTASEKSDKSDVRVFIVDNEVVTAMKRFSSGKDFRANYSISKKAEFVELTDEQKELALRSAAAVKCSGICGVDMITHYETKQDFIIEQNSNPGLKIEDVTGVNVSAKIVDFLERLAAGTANIQNEFAAKVEQEKLPSWHKSNFEKSVSGV